MYLMLQHDLMCDSHLFWSKSIRLQKLPCRSGSRGGEEQVSWERWGIFGVESVRSGGSCVDFLRLTFAVAWVWSVAQSRLADRLNGSVACVRSPSKHSLLVLLPCFMSRAISTKQSLSPVLLDLVIVIYIGISIILIFLLCVWRRKVWTFAREIW